MTTSGDHPSPGWYPDPHHRDQQRYWDGSDWTEHRQPNQPAADDTAVLPPTEPAPAARTEQPAVSGPDTARSSGGQHGWVAALVGLLVGLVVGGTAGAVIAGNNNDSSKPASESSSGAPASTVTATTTATATEAVTETATATATVTATVTETATPSP